LFSETSLHCGYKPEGSPTTMCPTLLDVLRKPAYGLTLLDSRFLLKADSSKLLTCPFLCEAKRLGDLGGKKGLMA
tara:strand:+ start:169 stop:393 length:225 start_codon:yes stop_codon:yes gene_type:complete